MNTTALLEAVRKDSRKGLLLVAERIGALVGGDGSLQELAKGLTGHLPEDERSRGIRDALLELLSAAEATRLNVARRRPPALVAKESWKEVLGQLADGNVRQLTKIAAALGENKKGSVSTVLDELEDEGLVEPAVGPGMAKNARYVRLTEGGLAFVATLDAVNVVPAVRRATPSTLPAPQDSGVNWFDASNGYMDVINLDSCRIAQSRSTLVFDLGNHPELSWKKIDVQTILLLAQVLAEATHDPVKGLRLSSALNLARPDGEFMKEVVPVFVLHPPTVGRTVDDAIVDAAPPPALARTTRAK